MKIIYYYHIPKCGGSTILDSLRGIADSHGGEYYDFNHRMPEFRFRDKLQNNFKLRNFYRSLNDQTTNLKTVHDHHGYYGIGEIGKILQREKARARSLGNELHLFTCIRDPFSFRISLVNFLRNTGELPNLTFDDICRQSGFQNAMSTYYLRNHPHRWRNVLLDKDSFVNSLGLMDRIFSLGNMAGLYSWLSEILETPIQEPTEKKNVSEHKLHPSDDQIEQLEQVNSFDRFFYDFVRSNETRTVG